MKANSRILNRISGVAPAVLVLFLSWPGWAAGTLEHPLFAAVRSGDLPMVKTLLDQGTPPDLRTKQGVTPLMLAARNEAPKMVSLLLARGADPNLRNAYGATALHWGAGDFKTVRLLLKAGANPNDRTKRNNTPLLVAASHPDSLRTVKLLVKHQAEIDLADRKGIPLVWRAARAGCFETVNFFLERGCAAHTDDRRRSPLVIAAGYGFAEVVDLLLANGADPDREGKMSNSALQSALLGEHHGIARKLVEAGASVHGRRATGGVSSLMLAAYTERANPSSIRLLLEKGADPNQTNERGETALGWARKRGFPEAIELLEKAGGPEGVLKRKEIPTRDLEGKDRQVAMRDSIQKGIDLMQLSSDTFLAKRESCVSCHQQNLPAVAMSWARDRGFKVSSKSLKLMMDRQTGDWARRLPRVYEMDSPVPVPPRFLGWGMLGFHAIGYPADEVTEAMSWYLASIQMPDGHWASNTKRPPMGGNEILGTVLAMRALQLYPVEGRRKDFARRLARARDWLQKQEPHTHQDGVFKLIGLGWAGVEAEELAPLVERLKSTQRNDGGWPQLPNLESDAWATGSALVALHIAGKMNVSDPVYQRGLDYLLRTQFEDGSWYVQSRTWPFQPHFDSRFPHGKDQWISAPATAWAVMAMTLAVKPDALPEVPARGEFVGGTAEMNEGNGAQETSAEDPPAKVGEFDFAGVIKPILTRSCLDCHSGGKPKSGLALSSRKALLKGGESGEPAIRPGRAADSLLARVVADRVEDMEMPPLSKRNKYSALSEEEIRQITAWIDAGAPWPEGLQLD